MLLFLIQICCALLFPGPSLAVEKVALSAAIDRAMDKNADLRSQRLQVRQAEADLDRVGGEFGPRIEGLWGIGPITKAQGNATYVVEDNGVWGRTLFGKISLTQPLYTWGRKGDYESAATAGIKVKEAESALKENQLRYEVKEAYYGYQLANSLRDFIADRKSVV